LAFFVFREGGRKIKNKKKKKLGTGFRVFQITTQRAPHC